MFLHASANLFPAGAVAFLGHSTSGKSTISRKLFEKYELISDDAIFIFNEKGKWFCANGDQRNFSFRDNNDIRLFFREKLKTVFPIRLFARIWKRSNVSAAKSNEIIIFKNLMDACMEVDIQRRGTATSVRKYLYSSIAGLARTISGCDLYFTKDFRIEEIEEVLINIDAELFQEG